MFLSLPRWSKEAIAAAMAILASTVAVVLASAPAQSAFIVTAVFPPWWNADDVRRAVEPIGAAASTGRAPNIVTIYGGSNLQARLRRAGVWLLLDPRLVSCGPPSELS